MTTDKGQVDTHRRRLSVKMRKSMKPCTNDTGKEVRTWQTGDDECDAYSTEYECGGVYNHNFMDIIGNRDHDCFWDCSGCNYK